jgi:hypothetical protein
MKVEIEVDDEFTDTVIRDSIKWHIDTIESDLNKMKKAKKLQKYQREDKAYFIKLLPALKIVGEYYGVKI